MSERKGGAGPLVAGGLLVAAVYYATCWPYLLGTWIAAQLGVDRPAVGWVLEGAYLLAVPGAVWLLRADRLPPRPLRRIAEVPLAVLAAAVVSAGVLLVR
ncbi:MAG TPA: hypothetical protein VFR35_09955 [Actinoplanes sp.]|nr:hypothetical protein [Actinoplanes sp.]